MIRAWRYEHGTSVPVDVAADQLAEAIEPKQALLWIDLETPSDADLDSIATQLVISPLALEDLHHAGQRTKLEHYGDHFHVAVHDCSLMPEGLVTREVDIVFGDGWLVSVRQPADSADEPAPFDLASSKRRFEIERGTEDTTDEGFLLWAILDVIVDRYFKVIDQFDDRLDDAEEIVFSADGHGQVPREVFDLRRGMVHFRRAVGAQLELRLPDGDRVDGAAHGGAVRVVQASGMAVAPDLSRGLALARTAAAGPRPSLRENCHTVSSSTSAPTAMIITCAVSSPSGSSNS